MFLSGKSINQSHRVTLISYSKKISKKNSVYGYYIFFYCFIYIFNKFHTLPIGLFVHLSVEELLVTGYLTLKIMWLKFLLIWRFFRLWALTDGVTPPENMKKCMSNNYSLESFWKGWHCSFHEWIVQYMYVPMGGRRTRLSSGWLCSLKTLLS
jgi:D-alanyl-lipoteichoic acid acyltransferase DltB (MBOAT superfamily)